MKFITVVNLTPLLLTNRLTGRIYWYYDWETSKRKTRRDRARNERLPVILLDSLRIRGTTSIDYQRITPTKIHLTTYINLPSKPSLTARLFLLSYPTFRIDPSNFTALNMLAVRSHLARLVVIRLLFFSPADPLIYFVGFDRNDLTWRDTFLGLCFLYKRCQSVFWFGFDGWYRLDYLRRSNRVYWHSGSAKLIPLDRITFSTSDWNLVRFGDPSVSAFITFAFVANKFIYHYLRLA